MGVDGQNISNFLEMFSLKNKTAIVTGAASGIGKAVAKLFAKQEADLYLLDINEKILAETVAEIKNNYGKAVGHKADVTNQQSINTIFENIGVIDILVNCAGISNIGKASTTSEEDFEKVFKVNVKGVYNCLHEAIPYMQKNGGGVIVNVGSVSAYTGIAERFAYSMSKGAVTTMTLSVAKDYIADGIRCNSVSPARIHTPFVDDYIQKNYPGKEKEIFEKLSKTQPIGRMGTPEEVASIILFLCSDEASFITGCDYPVDGGFTKLNT